jgi:glycosyltransferase WbpL
MATHPHAQGFFFAVGLAACTALLGALAVFAVRAVAKRRQLLDLPNDRSAHSVPTPRVGGVGIMAIFVPAGLVWSLATGIKSATVVLAATGAISLLGFVDDVRPLTARVRFAVQALAALAVVWARREALSGGATLLPLPDWVLAPLAILWIVWMTNLYNFMDGIDGLAAGQTIFASLGLAAGMAAAGSVDSASLLLLLAAASGGFLLFNFPPASIFMGDVGSTAIGFFLACVPFLPSARPVPVEAVGIAAGLFILDATTTLIRRMRNGESWYEAHRSHWYQRPLSLGVPHRTITLWAYAGMILLAIASAAFVQAGAVARVALLATPAIVFLPFAAAVRRIERARVPSSRAREAV